MALSKQIGQFSYWKPVQLLMNVADSAMNVEVPLGGYISEEDRRAYPKALDYRRTNITLTADDRNKILDIVYPYIKALDEWSDATDIKEV